MEKANRLNQLAWECRQRGWGYDDIALEAYDELLRIYRESGDRENEALTLSNMVAT